MHTRVVRSCWRPCGRPFTGHLNHWSIRPRYFPSKSKLVPKHWWLFELLTRSLTVSGAELSADHECATAPADKERPKAVVAKLHTLILCSHRPAIVKSTCSSLPIIELITLHIGRAPSQVAIEIIEVAANRFRYYWQTCQKNKYTYQSI